MVNCYKKKKIIIIITFYLPIVMFNLYYILKYNFTFFTELWIYLYSEKNSRAFSKIIL